MPDDQSSIDESTQLSYEEKCRNLKKKRAVLKGKLTKFQKKIDEATESGDTTQIGVRLPSFEKHLEEFESIQEKIEELEDSEDINNEERTRFEDNYFELLAKARALLPNINSHLSNSDNHVNIQQLEQITAEQNALSRIKLQPLDIPKFSGKYEDWRSFQDIFNSMVHNNQTISDAQKLLYLSDSLVGEAREVIKFLNITSENYEVARNLLIERYDKKQYIINAHLNSLYELPPMTKDSPVELRNLISSTKQHLRSVEALQVPIQDWDPMIIVLLKRKLDPITRRQWDLAQKNPNKIPPLKELYEFLEQRCFGLETNTPEKFINSPRNTNQTSTRSTAHLATNSTIEQKEACKLCSKLHNLYQCDIFIKQPVSERIQTIKSIGACFNCLRQGHPVRDCKTRHCKNCDRKHHTMIHKEKIEESKSTSNNHVVLNSTYSSHYEVLLATALIQVQNAQGQWIPCRALLDSASQSHFITQELAEKVNRRIVHHKISINGISHKGTEVNATTNVQLKSRISNFSRTIECLIIQDITIKLPTAPVTTDTWNLPCIQLADPTFGEPGTVDMLIGAELYFNLLKRDQIKLGEDLPILQNTVFGWVVSGKSQAATDQTTICHLTTLELHRSLEKFWSIEELEEKHHTTSEEQQCETHFKETHQKDETGRFIVKLPKRTDTIALGDSATNALKRLQSMERRMHKDPVFEQQYKSFLNEYKNLNHMTEITLDYTQKANFLPHHAVIKDTSTTTKLRVVFDGSSKTSSGVSLNDILLVGPKLQPDLFSILTRFRQHTYVITADIEKMYRQILVHQDDRHLQQILWRDKSDQEAKAYQLNTVTYGLASSPYLAIRCIRQLAYEHEATYSNASKVILNDFYVDDLLTGEDTIEKVQQLKEEITTILQHGKFHLRKWKSNNMKLTNNDQSGEVTDLLMDSSVSRILGISWQPNGDYLQYSVIEEPTEQHEKLDHCGPTQLLASIRLYYWPIAGRNLARKIVRTCVKCIRYKPVIPEYIMADLPADRVTPSRPFFVTGVDYAGPVQLREARRRGRYNTTKAYIAVFVCFSTKAVHLELVTSLTTESFLAALSRFVSRRGLCSKMFSDNGTNFVGTDRELTEMYDFVKNNSEYIAEHLSKRKIEWHFIPPRAPHFGGIWEAAVKSFKKHFYKVSHNLTLTFEECYTLITQIEAILNSRPLVPVSSDPNDLSYLCPAHFLIGDYLLEPPSPSYSQVVDNRLSLFQHIQKVKQHFWNRWKRDYLQHLQLRSQWSTGQHDIQVGTMVIIAEDNTPPLQWALGRVTAIHPGEDGVVRVVSVKTTTGVFKRPIKKLCALPVH